MTIRVLMGNFHFSNVLLKFHITIWISPSDSLKIHIILFLFSFELCLHTLYLKLTLTFFRKYKPGKEEC